MVDAPQPPFGAVVVAKARAPTTVAHEIGHFLGLCHTHFEYQPPSQRVVRWEADDGRQRAILCDTQCRTGGDGVCDTPEDPGPPSCSYDASCQVACGDPAQPDARNLMSYYTACRDRFSVGQAMQLRRGAALRRGWHRCLFGAGCPCDPIDPECPEQMTCRPWGEANAFRCGLDGPKPQGQACAHHDECGAGALCFAHAGQPQCLRPCVVTSPGCSCVRKLGAGVGYCQLE